MASLVVRCKHCILHHGYQLELEISEFFSYICNLYGKLVFKFCNDVGIGSCESFVCNFGNYIVVIVLVCYDGGFRSGQFYNWATLVQKDQFCFDIWIGLYKGIFCNYFCVYCRVFSQVYLLCF